MSATNKRAAEEREKRSPRPVVAVAKPTQESGSNKRTKLQNASHSSRVENTAVMSLLTTTAEESSSSSSSSTTPHPPTTIAASNNLARQLIIIDEANSKSDQIVGMRIKESTREGYIRSLKKMIRDLQQEDAAANNIQGKLIRSLL